MAIRNPALHAVSAMMLLFAIYPPSCSSSFSQVIRDGIQDGAPTFPGDAPAGDGPQSSQPAPDASAATFPSASSESQEVHRGATFFLGARYTLGQLTEQERCQLSQANVAVLTGDFDNIGMLLTMLGVNHTVLNRTSSEEHVRSALRKEPCRVAMLNGGAHLIDRQLVGAKMVSLVARLTKRLMKIGGTIVTTDSAMELLHNPPFPVADWVLKDKALRHLSSVRLLRTPRGNESQLSDGDGPCTRDEKVVDIVTTLSELLNRFQSSPRWHLATTSHMVRHRQRRLARSQLFSLLRSDDLPSRWDSVLSCGESGRGAFWHVTGPLAQSFPGQRRNGQSGIPMNHVMLYMFLHNDLLSLNEEEETHILHTISTLTAAGMPLIVEDIATAAISTTWLVRFVLQSWREHGACVPVACRPECLPTAEQGTVPSSCVTTTVADSGDRATVGASSTTLGTSVASRPAATPALRTAGQGQELHAASAP